MTATVILILVFAALSLLDLPKLIKRKNTKELLVYGAILGTAFILSELHALDVDMWSPNRVITDIVRFVVPVR
jgi:hypothetical protein